MNDTLQTILNSIQYNTSQNIDLIEKVNSFYDSAWNKLVLFGSILFALVGIVVPFIIQWYQKKTLNLSEKNLKTDLKKELESEMKTFIEKKFIEHEKQLKSVTAGADARIFFSQAKFSIEKGEYKTALGEVVTASFSSVECENFPILQEILEFLLDKCLPKLSIEEITDLKTANICDLHSLLETLSKNDDKKIFQNKIGDIKVLLGKLPKNIQDKPETQVKVNG